MTQAFLDMMYLFSCSVTGKPLEKTCEADFKEIYARAVEQGVMHNVYESAKALYDNGMLNIEEDWFNIVKNISVKSVLMNIQRNYVIHKLFEELEKNKVKYCLLKGEALAQFYHNPELRISGDTDIFVVEEDKDKALKTIEAFGFEVDPHIAISHHIEANHPIGGKLEIHFSLYEKMFEDVWFDNKVLVQEEYRKIQTKDGSEICTLGITDGLIFTTMHYTKHFLVGGVGIRQLMDVILYMSKYRLKIDWERFNSIIEHLKYKKFIDNSIGIGVKYLNISSECLPRHICDNNIMEKMLDDFEQGGLFGKKEEERKGFYFKYTQIRFNRFKNENYKEYLKKWVRLNLKDIIFPSTTTLAKKFPYFKKSTALYFIAWIHSGVSI